MMKLLAMTAAFAVLAIFPVAAQSIGEKTGVNSVLGFAPKTDDFVKEVAMSDMFEIRSSELAEQKATTDDAKKFAAQMIADHTKTSAELKSLAPNKSALPNALDSSLQSKLDKLKGIQGDTFTMQYNSDQLSAHKDAVNLFQRYAKNGDNAQLKDWAARTLPTLEHHLEMAQALNKK